MTHFIRWATRFATLPTGHTRKDIYLALCALPRAEKLKLIGLVEGKHEFDVLQTGDGTWSCRIRIGSSMTVCSRQSPGDAISHALNTPGMAP